MYILMLFNGQRLIMNAIVKEKINTLCYEKKNTSYNHQFYFHVHCINFFRKKVF